MDTQTLATRLRAGTVGVVLALALAGCSASVTPVVAQTTDADSVATAAAAEPVRDEAQAAQADEPVPAAVATAVPTAIPVPTATPAPEPLLVGATAIITTTPQEGAGLTPTFAWESVADASRYFLIVRDEAGAPYWSWSGAESEITMHGGGPVIAEGYTWSVSAFDEQDGFLAISASVPIAP